MTSQELQPTAGHLIVIQQQRGGAAGDDVAVQHAQHDYLRGT